VASGWGDNCVFRDNIFEHGLYGIKRDSTLEGSRSLTAIFGEGNYVFSHNVGANFPDHFYAGVAGEANDYPTLSALHDEFEDARGGNLRLVAESKYRAGALLPPYDGAMRGADVAKVDCFLGGVANVTGE
jgi:hypothetical protein